MQFVWERKKGGRGVDNAASPKSLNVSWLVFTEGEKLAFLFTFLDGGETAPASLAGHHWILSAATQVRLLASEWQLGGWEKEDVVSGCKFNSSLISLGQLGHPWGSDEGWRTSLKAWLAKVSWYLFLVVNAGTYSIDFHLDILMLPGYPSKCELNSDLREWRPSDRPAFFLPFCFIFS